MIEVEIESLSYNGGRGIARHDGLVIFVPGTAAKDVVRIEIIEQKKSFAIGRLIEIVKPSPFRRTPPCPVAGVCGGCTWQHITYEEQVNQKQKILEHAIRPLLKLNPNLKVEKFLAAENEFHYRNRIQIHVNRHGAGFLARESHDLVPTDQCWISDPRLVETMNQISNNPDERFNQRIELSVDQQGQVTRNTLSDFEQVNNEQNKELQAIVVDWVKQINEPWNRVIDLYSGSGNFLLPLSEKIKAKEWFGIEMNATLVNRANKKNPNIKWLQGDVANRLKEFNSLKKSLIVTDPPRPGMSTIATKELLRVNPDHVVYISCNPMTFVRDAQTILQSKNYQLVRLQGVDLFPQTEHIELVAHFTKLSHSA